MPFFSIAGVGREAGRVEEEHEDVVAVARAHGVSIAQIRLAWMLGRGRHVLVIPGTGDVRHLEENVAAGAVRLTEDELARLDAVHERGQ